MGDLLHHYAHHGRTTYTDDSPALMTQHEFSRENLALGASDPGASQIGGTATVDDCGPGPMGAPIQDLT